MTCRPASAPDLHREDREDETCSEKAFDKGPWSGMNTLRGGTAWKYEEEIPQRKEEKKGPSPPV